jgi:OmpR-family two-component system manganese-sensing response regulator
MPKILIVDDDIELAEKIQEFLLQDDHVVEVVHSGADATQLLNNFNYDLIILDWTLGDTTGLAVCQQYRGKGGLAPIMFLTGRDSVANKEEGLNSGADDYLTKPFHPRELTARVKACLRRPRTLQLETLVAGDLSLDRNQRKLAKAGEAIHLRPKEYALMEFLMCHPNQYFSAKDLLDSIWKSDTETSEDTIRTSIKTLRRKISAEHEECPIKTSHGFGYKFEVEP